MLLRELGKIAVAGHAQHLDAFFFQGIGQGTNAQARGILGAEIFVNDHNRKTKLHGTALPKNRRAIVGQNPCSRSGFEALAPGSWRGYNRRV